MSMYKQFKTDEGLEQAGVELLYDGFRVTVARAGGSNKRFARLMDEKMKPYRRAFETGTLADKTAMKVLREVYAKGAVLNWEVERPLAEGEGTEWVVGLDPKEEGGEIQPFTPENVIQAFTDLPDLFLDIKAQAERVALFREDIREAEAGN